MTPFGAYSLIFDGKIGKHLEQSLAHSKHLIKKLMFSEGQYGYRVAIS